jgi:heme oxygenase
MPSSAVLFDPIAIQLSMEDLRAKLEKLLTEAENCDLIGRLATDLNKRELFKRLAHDLRQMTRDIEAEIATHVPK